jgi:hypothetical protein
VRSHSHSLRNGLIPIAIALTMAILVLSQAPIAAGKKQVERLYVSDSGGSIRGYIIAMNDKPIANARLLLFLSKNHKIGSSTTSDKKGYFIFRKVPFNESLDLKVEATGYIGITEEQMSIDSSHSILLTIHLFDEFP